MLFRKSILPLTFLLFISCGNKKESITPMIQPITESVYASGTLKSKNQYQVFPNVSGIIDAIFVKEGDTVKVGQPILKIYNMVQELNKENAELSAAYSDFNSNKGKLDDAFLAIGLAKDKMYNDSLLFNRQETLKAQGIGTEIEYEQSMLDYHNSKNAYYSAKVRYDDLKRQIDFNSAQSKKNVQISSTLANDLTVVSQINGVVYNLTKEVGEMVNTQTALAVIGDATEFEMEMQVDENDILRIKIGQQVFVTLDSYQDLSFEGSIIEIDPMMNQSTKTFTVTAIFLQQPEVLYPNMNFEASIVIQTKKDALLIPRNYLFQDSLVIKSSGDTVAVKTGLKDYKMVEILSGISATDEITKPAK
jgi:RND family efflux transporter MFP subunit